MSSDNEPKTNNAKKNRGNHREKILLNGDSDSSSSRVHGGKHFSPPLPPLYNQSSSSPSSTPPPLPEKTLTNGLTKSTSAYSMIHPDGCHSDPIVSLSNGRPKSSVSPYLRQHMSKTTSDTSLNHVPKNKQHTNLKLSTNSFDVQGKSHRSSSLNRVTCNQMISSTTGIGLGKRDSFPNRSSAIFTPSLSSTNENKRAHFIAKNKRSNSSALIELKSTTQRIPSSSKPPPPPSIMTRATPSTRPLQRKISRNSLSSNSSVSSQTTEDTTATTGSSGTSSGSNGVGLASTSSGVSSMSSNSSIRRRISSASTSSAINGTGYLDTDTSYLKWKVRKREEKRLKERRNYLEHQLRRH